MKLKLPMAFALAFTMGIPLAHAGMDKDGGKNGLKPLPIPSKEISWDEFRARCQSPKDFDSQVAPANIQVSCTGLDTEFVNDQPGVFPLGGSRQVVTAVYSSKLHVGDLQAKDVPIQQKSGNCLRYKEVVRKLTVQRPMSCSEIVGIKGGLDDYCASLLDEARGENPKMLESRDTGRYIDTCGAIQITTVNPNAPAPGAPANPGPASNGGGAEGVPSGK